MLVKFAAALCVFAVAASAQKPKENEGEENKEGTKPDESGGMTEFVVIKENKDGMNLKNIKS